MKLNDKIADWQKASLIDDTQAAAIRQYEAARPDAVSMLWRHGLLGLGVLAIGIGLVAIIAANWSDIPASLKLIAHVALNLGVATVLVRWWQKNLHATPHFERLLSIKAVLVLTLIALIGQIMHTQAPLEDALTLWWALITPMLLLFSRHRVNFLLWTCLTLGVVLTQLDILARPFLVNTLTIGFIHALALLPLFAWWRDHKGQWSPSGARLAVGIVMLGVNFLFFDNVYDGHYTSPGSAQFVARHAFELALTANMAAGYLVLAARARSFHPLVLWQGAGVAERVVFTHLALALIVIHLPHWFGWFMLYWLGAGYVGLKRDDRRLVALSITLLAGHILWLYFDLTHSLMTTGVLMIGGGIVMLYLVKTYPRWRAALITLLGGTP